MEYSWDGANAAGPAAGIPPLARSRRLGRDRLLPGQPHPLGGDFRRVLPDLDYRSADFTLNPWKKLQFRGSYLDQRRNTAILPYFLPFYDRTIQAGFQYQASSWFGLSLEERIHDRQDLSQDARFDYRDSTLRAGAMAHFGPLNLQGYLDIGPTHNTLTGESEHLAETLFRRTPSSSTGSRWAVMSITGTRRKLHRRPRAAARPQSQPWLSGRTDAHGGLLPDLGPSGALQTALSEKSFETPSSS